MSESSTDPMKEKFKEDVGLDSSTSTAVEGRESFEDEQRRDKSLQNTKRDDTLYKSIQNTKRDDTLHKNLENPNREDTIYKSFPEDQIELIDQD